VPSYEYVSDRILFVVPAYKPYLDIPGGVAEELIGLKLLTFEQAEPPLRPSMARRVESAIDALKEDSSRYLEFGRTRRPAVLDLRRS
jgi:hypothetical protein